jgi:demethylmenaquinone methyltransferase/2-methoxy-6-polyprenyl-1,4-benzoquinol methylase
MDAHAAAPSPRTRHAVQLFAGLPGRYERMGAILSFGQDPRWRRTLAAATRLSSGGRALDVATGTGAVAREVLRRNPGASVVGLDQSEPMLREGVRRSGEPEVEGRARFVLGRAERLPFPDQSFDAVTFTYLLRYVDDPESTVGELARVLRPGGTMAGLEFHVPEDPWYRVWNVYCRGVMPAIGRAVSPAWHEVAAFLGPNIETYVRAHPLTEQLAWWRRAGITDARARRMTFGSAVVTWGTKRER